MTIPELGTITATHPPVIVLTSNRTRDLHDAVKRRCLYRWIDYPTPEREVEIVRRRVKGAPRRWRSRSPTPSRGCATATCRSRPGSPRRSTGWRRSTCSGSSTSTPRRDRPHPRLGAQVRRGPGGDPRGRPRAARAQRWLRPRERVRVETIHLDLAPLAGTLGRRLRDAGVPVTPERSAAFARALTLVRPVARRRLYWTARAVFVSDRPSRGLRRRLLLGLRRPARDGGVEPDDAGSRRRADRAPDRTRPREARRRRTSSPAPRAARTTTRRARGPAGDRERRGAAGRQALRRARAARAGAALSADVAAASWRRRCGARAATSAAATAARIDLRRTLRAQPAHRRRPDPPRAPPPPHRSAAGW